MIKFMSICLIAVSATVHVIAQDISDGSVPKPRPPTIDELLLFFPDKYPEGQWQPARLMYQDVFFTAEDNTKLHGWYCKCDKPRAVVLIAHGNAGSIASAGRVNWLRYLTQRAKLTVFMFDYRGYGRSEGTPTVEGAIQDATAARAKLCELAGVKDSEMLLMGESLGGAIVVQLAAKSAPRGLVLQSTFSSMREAAEVHYPRLAWLVPRERLDSCGAIVQYKGPLLQSHGDRDHTIPIPLARRLFDAANEPKRFYAISGADHNNWTTEAYLQELTKFIDGL